MSVRFKWVVLHWGMATFLIAKPKKCRGGYITKNGDRYVGTDIMLVARDQYEGGEFSCYDNC